MIETIWSVQEPSEGLDAAIEAAVTAALTSERRVGGVCLQIVNGNEIQRMNRDFRHMDAVTDVLSFPAWEGDALMAPPDGYLGDIAICYPRAAEQAAAYGHSLGRELCFLAVHGALHLCGYDHMDAESERLMMEKQEQILKLMGVER